MPPERYERTRQGLAELVAMRNELAHHFLERFNNWTEAGCQEADAYLSACYDRIDRHYVELRGWAETMDDSRAWLATFMQTSQFEDAIVDGIWPDGTVHWPISGIVACLRNAEQACAVNGWTLLDSAIVHIRTRDPIEPASATLICRPNTSKVTARMPPPAPVSP